MGLAGTQARLLALTWRQGDLECNISICSMRKMALAREQTQLAQQYSARLQSKDIAFYADGKYQKMTYGYLMGYGINTMATMKKNPSNIKSDNSMILTDSSGLVVMNSQYASALAKVLGYSCMNSKGRGGTFSADKIPAIIAAVAGSPLTEENVKEVINGGKLDYNYSATKQNDITGQKTGSTTVDASDTYTQMIEQLTNFYYPIFLAASANGWTTEYNKTMKENDNYISDALVSGIFQLAQVNSEGSYDPDASLSYFVMSGLVSERNDSSKREEITAWYNAEKAAISEKEGKWDIQLQNFSTELEATKTERDSLKSILEDNMKPFEIFS